MGTGVVAQWWNLCLVFVSHRFRPQYQKQQ